MSKYINLIDELSDNDKNLIKEYIYAYGVHKDKFIGLDEWLSNWSHSNQTLFKLLGNQLIKEYDFEYEKDKNTLRQEFSALLKFNYFDTQTKEPCLLKKSYHAFYVEYITPLHQSGKITNSQKAFFNSLLDVDNFLDNKIYNTIKFQLPNAKKMLQIQAGAKPLRAISKVIDYFKDEYKIEGFEEFRVAHSLILNDKKVRGKMCISIHPLDFMTMSDNNSNWSSCMNWIEKGCYRVGSIEMMTSNCVVCCYLKADSPFVFKDGCEWNNKKWRELIYINKNIIMSGKAYPFRQEDFSKRLLTMVKDLAEENLHWNYTYGIEPYEDMIHITSKYRLNKQHEWMNTKTSKKKNILWETNGMYNDMLNDNNYPFFCYRNKVDSTKIYSVSGKCPCLICGESIIKRSKWFDDEHEDYNERYQNVGNVLCLTCYDTLGQCDMCGRTNPTEILNILKSKKGKKIKICNSCAKEHFFKCPCCGKPMYICSSNYNFYIKNYFDKNIEPENNFYFSIKAYNNESEFQKMNGYDILFIDPYYYYYYSVRNEPKDLKNFESNYMLERIYMCEECNFNFNLLKENYKKIDRHSPHKSCSDQKYFKLLDPQKFESYRIHHCEKVPIDKIEFFQFGL